MSFLKIFLQFLIVLFLFVSCVDEDDHDNGSIPSVISNGKLIDFHIVIDGNAYYPVDTINGNLHIFVPSGTNLSCLKAFFNNKDGEVFIDSVPQISGITENDFSNFQEGVRYIVKTPDGGGGYIVRVVETKLPVVVINTDDGENIIDKINWKDAEIKIYNSDGTGNLLDSTYIRGRGNMTWVRYPKKPYSLKLKKKQSILGMPKHKRWVLLSLYTGYIGNAMAFEVARRTPAIEWSPRGKYVELLLNGNFQGLYYLCEQIKIDKNRVNISEMSDSDIEYPNVSGGFLLEFDELYDEEYKFKSTFFDLPVQLKSPNDNVQPEQMEYISRYIDNLETELKKLGTSALSHYDDYIDIVNFADYWLSLEIIGNYEAYKPRSVKMYKGRDGIDSAPGSICKLKAGPLWDQEAFEVYQRFNTKEAWWFSYLFKDPRFVKTVKDRWPIIRARIMGAEKGYSSFMDYLDSVVDHIYLSAERDFSIWNNNWRNVYFKLDDQIGIVREGFLPKIYWMDEQISSLTIEK